MLFRRQNAHYQALVLFLLMIQILLDLASAGSLVLGLNRLVTVLFSYGCAAVACKAISAILDFTDGPKAHSLVAPASCGSKFTN